MLVKQNLVKYDCSACFDRVTFSHAGIALRQLNRSQNLRACFTEVGRCDLVLYLLRVPRECRMERSQAFLYCWAHAIRHFRQVSQSHTRTHTLSKSCKPSTSTLTITLTLTLILTPLTLLILTLLTLIRSCHAHFPPPFRPRLACSYLAKSQPQPGCLPLTSSQPDSALSGKCTVWRALIGQEHCLAEMTSQLGSQTVAVTSSAKSMAAVA